MSKLTLYSARAYPFAHRTRLVLADVVTLPNQLVGAVDAILPRRPHGCGTDQRLSQETLV